MKKNICTNIYQLFTFMFLVVKVSMLRDVGQLPQMVLGLLVSLTIIIFNYVYNNNNSNKKNRREEIS